MLGRDVLAQHEDLIKHGIADAAGVVSHSSGGQPYPADIRMNAIPAAVKEKIIELLKENSNVT